jgi:hypothetical protein
MNDTAYAYDVAKNLVQMGEALFASSDAEERELARELLLDSDELHEAAESPDYEDDGQSVVAIDSIPKRLKKVKA